MGLEDSHIKNFTEINPLSDPQKKELEADLKLLFGDNLQYSNKNNEICWRIAEKFGERAIPYILRYLGDGGVHPDPTVVGKFLDTLVTDKTAPLVLQAIQENTVHVAYGVIAAAQGKEKTVKGIEKLLIDYEIKSANRSDFVRMIEALAETGVDSASLSVAQFYEKLRANQDYAEKVQKHLEQIGTNLHSNDAYDIVQALAKLGGPKSKKLLEHFAKDGDEYIKGFARRALDGTLYLGKPLKWKLENPVHKTDYYSTESDADLYVSADEWDKDFSDYSQAEQEIDAFLEEEYDAFDMIEDDTELPPQPESLGLQGERIPLIDPETIKGEEVSVKFIEYLRGQTNVFELLENLKSSVDNSKARHLQKRERSDTLLVAACLEALRSILKVPNYKSMREAIDILNDSITAWNNVGNDEESGQIAGRLARFYTGIDSGVEGIRQDDMRLPESALPFELWHAGMQRSRDIQPFTDLLRKKLEPYFAEQALKLVTGYLDTNIVVDLLRRTMKLFSLYREVADIDVPLYKNAADKLKQIGRDKEKIFYGRDADYFFYAVKALQFGQKDEVKPKKIYINRTLKDALLGEDSAYESELRERVMAYLLQEKIPADALHIDSGFQGSVPEAVIRVLDPSLSEDEINERIKLLSSARVDREEISGLGESAVGTVESRSKHYGTITNVIRDERNGKLRVVYNKPDPWREIEAWVIDQAVIRHFAPRAPFITAKR